MSADLPWKKRRARPIGWHEADEIEEKLRNALLYSKVPKGALERIAGEHSTSQLTIKKLAQSRGLGIAR